MASETEAPDTSIPQSSAEAFEPVPDDVMDAVAASEEQTREGDDIGEVPSPPAETQPQDLQGAAQREHEAVPARRESPAPRPAAPPVQRSGAPRHQERPARSECYERPPEPFQPVSPQSIQQAIEETNRIIETLKATLEDMDELLETLELAERQKDADEREIESLRRALHHMQRPREGGSPRH